MPFDPRAAARRALAVASQPGGGLPHVVTPQEQALWTPEDQHAAAASIYGKLCELVDMQAELLRTLRRKDTAQLPISIGGMGIGSTGAPYILRTQGYRHSRIFVGGAATINLSDPPGTSLTLAAGWNLLDLRDGCELTNTTIGVLNALLELTDELVVR